MGSMTQALRGLSGTDDASRRSKEQLELLLLAAKAKIQSYREEINASFLDPGRVDRPQIPGIRALRYIEQYHVASREDFAAQASAHLSTAIGSFFSISGVDEGARQAIQAGVHRVISAALGDFIGAGAAGETEQAIQLVVPENEVLIRVDVACWRYNFAQEKLVSQSDAAAAYVLCKSTVDHGRLTLDELIAPVTALLPKAGSGANPEPGAAAVEAYVRELTRVWNHLKGNRPGA